MVEIADCEKQLVEASRNRVGHMALVNGNWTPVDDVRILYMDGTTAKSVTLVARKWADEWNACAKKLRG